MSQSPTSVETGSPRRVTPRLSPLIRQVVGDVERPLKPFPTVTTGLSALPGDLSFRGGLRMTLGWSRNGVDHLWSEYQRLGPVQCWRYGTQPMVFLMDHGEVHRMGLNEEGIWSDALLWREWFAGVSRLPTLDFITAVDFGKHADMRRLLGPAFSGSALSSYMAMATDTYDRTIERWLQQGGCAFKREARLMFANLSARIFSGIDDSEETAFLDRAVADVWSAPRALSKSRWLSVALHRARAGMDRLENTLEKRLQERRKAPLGDDLFSRMSQSEHGIDWIDDPALVQLFIGIMVAAFDTTSLSVTSMAYMLATHPEWQERLREEGKAIAPGDLQRQDLKRLPMHDWAWREVQRRMPVAGAIARRPLCDVELGGWAVPAGAFVMGTFSAAHLDPKYFRDPLAFDPARFSPERREDENLPGGFMPWGAGPHTCIGAQLSTLEALSFWHAFLARARIRLAKPYRARHVTTPLGVVSGKVELRVEPL